MGVSSMLDMMSGTMMVGVIGADRGVGKDGKGKEESSSDVDHGTSHAGKCSKPTSSIYSDRIV